MAAMARGVPSPGRPIRPFWRHARRAVGDRALTRSVLILVSLLAVLYGAGQLALNWINRPSRSAPPAVAPPLPPLPSLDPGSFNTTHAWRELEDFIRLGPRDAGTAGAERAAAHIASRLASLGLNPVIDTFSAATPDGTGSFRNVTATLPRASGTQILLASHYDTKSGIPDFAGANDSGSSTAVLLELARSLPGQWPAQAPTLVFAFLDGEECVHAYSERDGLHGSRRLARQLVKSGQHTHTLAVVVLDMVGDRNLSVTLPRNSSPGLLAAALKAARDERAREQFSLWPTDILDDHVPFLEARIPAIDLIDFQYGSAPGLNDYWHTKADTLDKLSPQSLETVGRVTLRLLDAVMRAPREAVTAPRRRSRRTGGA